VASGALLAVAVVALLAVSSGPAALSPASASRPYVSRAERFSLRIPPGWQRARARLVPKLLMPREILSVGTFPMPVGGGGNCGREPAAAIERMKPGDALVSIQEVAVTEKMRARLAQGFPPRPSHFGLPRLPAPPRARGSAPQPGPGETIFSLTLSFSAHGRAFDALIYTKGRPTPARREQIETILGGLHFGAVPRAAERAIGAPRLRQALSYGPYIGVSCPHPNSTRCGRVGLDLVLRQKAEAVSVVVGGRHLRLISPGPVPHDASARGRDWGGYLNEVGLETPGSPFHIPGTRSNRHWAGDPPVYLPVRVVIVRVDGSRLGATLPRVILRPGFG
jgi:hypothetical protein